MFNLSQVKPRLSRRVNEAERLEETLEYDFGDGSALESFDQICDLAQALFATPIVAVSLMHRDILKVLAHRGVADVELPRKDTFCNLTIQRDDVLVIPDASADPRYAGNPYVTGPESVRFYAGVPLITRRGVCLGSMCVIDREKRDFPVADRAKLQMLGQLAMNELERRRALIDLQRQQSLWTQAANVTQLGSWSCDLTTGAVEMSSQTLAILGFDGDNPSEDRLRDLLMRVSSTPSSLAFLKNISLGAPIDEEVQIVTDAGHIRWVRLVGQPEYQNGQVIRVSGGIQDITSDRMRAEEIRRLAFKDHLTGLPNRAAAVCSTETAISQASLNKSHTGFILLDLDHFKDLNLAYGTEAGNNVLRQVGERLTEAFKGVGQVARQGGDEFSILLPNMQSRSQVLRIANRARAILSHPAEHDGQDVSISASLGVACAKRGETSHSELSRHASLALGEAKTSGRNRAVMFTDEMAKAFSYKDSILRDVERGIHCGEFEPFFQPIIDLKTRSVKGFEALIRWRHPHRGLLTPGKFMPAFHDQTLSLAMDELMLGRILHIMRKWLEQGVEFGQVAVNFSPAQFYRHDFDSKLLGKLKRFGIPAERFVLEITEDVYLGWNGESVMQSIEDLRTAGVTIALDDFGTGYASLSHLLTLPVDRLKIDRSFVQGEAGEAVLNGILTITDRLGLDVVAEGVEYPSQLKFLGDLGCDAIQGYIFSRPLRADRVARFLETWPGSPKQASIGEIAA